MPKILKRMGFKVTSESFTEEEDFLKPRDLGESLPAMVVDLNADNKENDQQAAKNEDDEWGDFQDASANDNSPNHGFSPVFSSPRSVRSVLLPPTQVLETHILSAKFNADDNQKELRKLQQTTRKKFVTSVDDIKQEKIKSQIKNKKANANKPSETLFLVEDDVSEDDAPLLSFS
jgi:hypothetical protein